MRLVNCRFPIRVRLAGWPNEADLPPLVEALSSAVRGRLVLARRVLAEQGGDPGRARCAEPTITFPPDTPPAHRDRLTAALRQGLARALDGEGAGPREDPPLRLVDYRPRRPAAARPAARAGSRRPWLVREVVDFHTRVGDFLELIVADYPEQAGAASVYLDLYDRVRWVEAWVVEVRREMELADLRPLLVQRTAELAHLRDDQAATFILEIGDSLRQRLGRIDRDGIVERELPDLSRGPLCHEDRGPGQVTLRAGCRLIYAWMVLPRITLDDVAVLEAEVELPSTRRELGFLIDAGAFAERFGVSWAAYVAEFGDQPATLRIRPFTTRRRVHSAALRYFLGAQALAAAAATAAVHGDLYLLAQSLLEVLPPAVRSALGGRTDALTLGLDEEQRDGFWESGWRGAFVWTALAPSEDEIQAALYRPDAREAADRLIPRLSADPTVLAWQYDLLRFLRASYEGGRRDRTHRRGLAFEYLLQELASRERGRWFEALFDAVERTQHWDLHHLLIRLCLETAHADHPRVRRTIEVINALRRSRRANSYRVAPPAIVLGDVADRTVRVDDVIADVDGLYSLERDAWRIRESRRPAVAAAVESESRELLGQLARGEDGRQYTGEEFAGVALARAVQRLGLSRDDFEQVTIERSLRFIGLEVRSEEAIAVTYVTYELVERLNGGSWETVPESRRTDSDADFELLLWSWGFNKSAVVVEAFATGVSILAVAVAALEAGIVALLLDLAGGATTVLVSIGLSELSYVYRAVTGNAHWSLEGFLEAALDGYLTALAFRGAGALGRSLARSVGTQTVRRLVGGWVAERLAVGALGGAGSAALTTFSDDLIWVMGHGGGFRSARDYVSRMSWGALLGVAFEFGVGALQPILRAGGQSGLQTLGEVVQEVRAAGLSPARWTALAAEALGRLRASLGRALEAGAAGELTAEFRARLAQVSEQLAAEVQLAVFRRVLELSPEVLTRLAVDGLERFLALTGAPFGEQAALDLLNGLTPAQLRGFLEALPAVDEVALGQIARSGRLPGLAADSRLLVSVGRDPVVTALIRSAADLPGEAGAGRTAAILDFLRTRPAVPESVPQGSLFARGGTSEVLEVPGRPDLLLKLGGGRLPREAAGLVELELLGIRTVYAATRAPGGQTQIIVERIEGVGSKDIIGRLSAPLRPPQHVEVITQRTIEDLERIYRILSEGRTNIGDFQFIVRRADGAVFVNDPVSVTSGSGPSGTVRSIIDRFRRILRQRTEGDAP